MNQLFLQLTVSVAGNVATIVILEIIAAIIGFTVAKYYAKSVYIPVIKGLEADKNNLKDQVTGLREKSTNLETNLARLEEKIESLNVTLGEKKIELEEITNEHHHIGKYAVSKAKNGEFYFNLKAANGQIILTSSFYKSVEACNEAIEFTRANCSVDERFERKTSSNNKHFFRFTSTDSHAIGKSEMYESVASMEKGIASVKRNGFSMTVVED